METPLIAGTALALFEGRIGPEMREKPMPTRPGPSHRETAVNRSSRLSATVGSIVVLALSTSAAANSWVRDIPVSGVGTLRIDLDFGSVRVDSHALGIAHIEADVRGLGANAYVLALHDDGNQLTLTGRAAPWLDLLTATPRVEIRVLVPADFSLDIVTRSGTVDVSSVSGALVRTRFGSVRAHDIRGSVDIETRDGGEIDIDGVAGSVVAGSWNAPIRARFSHAPNGLIHTRGGGIEIAYPEGVGTHLSAWAPSGCVWIDGVIRSGCGQRIRPVRVPVNGGGLPLELRASRGNIVLLPEPSQF